jgi:hypothetical protein
VGSHGMDHPAWMAQFTDPTLQDAVALNALRGLACERTGAPGNDSQYFQLVVEQRPVTQFPTPIAENADNVPRVYSAQLLGSCGFDVGYDQVWVNSDLTVFCSDKNIPDQ